MRRPNTTVGRVNIAAGSDGERAAHAISFLEACFDPAEGFRFAVGGVTSSMSLYYGILALEQLGALQSGIGVKLRSCLMETRPEPIRDQMILNRHPVAYFQEEQQAFLLQARDALGLNPFHEMDAPWPVEVESPDAITRFFSSLPWDDPWRDSNRVMFALSRVAALMTDRNREDLRAVMFSALDWLDARQSSVTGLWGATPKASLGDCMAATFHFSFYYFWLDRPLKYPERIIDSCLSLQEDHGLFSGPFQIGQNCLDYDAIDLLVKCSTITSYRKSDVEAALIGAKVALMSLQNPDGGFSNCRFCRQPRVNIPGTKSVQRRWACLNPSGRIRRMLLREVPASGNYNVCLNSLQCRNDQSNVFCTWFRSLAINLCDTILDPTGLSKTGNRFRKLPFLGYHPTP